LAANQPTTPTPEIDTFAGYSNEPAFFMKLNFSKYPISGEAYSKRPMAFLDIVPGKILGGILELALIETGNRAARERWQKAQLRNLLAHASKHFLAQSPRTQTGRFQTCRTCDPDPRRAETTGRKGRLAFASR